MIEAMKIKCYSEFIKIPTYEGRYEYLKIGGQVGIATFGFDRYLNQAFYQSPEWKRARYQVIARDNGCDLGFEGYEIQGKVLVHHMNQITEEDILNRNPDIYNPEFLISVTPMTHNAIHYGDASLLRLKPVERKPNDTCPWKY